MQKLPRSPTSWRRRAIQSCSAASSRPRALAAFCCPAMRSTSSGSRRSPAVPSSPPTFARMASADPVVVLSYRLWLRLFQGDNVAIGKTLRLNNMPHTIVGVMPPRFGWYGTTRCGCRWRRVDGTASFVQPDRPARAGRVAARRGRAAARVLSAASRRRDPSAFPAQGFTTTLHNYLDVTVASGDMRTSCACCSARWDSCC